MKKYASLSAAAALVLLSSAFALIHAARNRSGPPVAEITLTDRELTYHRDTDDSGVLLRFQYSHLNEGPLAPAWLPPERIRALGFETSVDPADTRAYDHYRSQSPRRAWVAFEYDGPAWRRAFDSTPETDRQARALPRGSRLIAVDAALTAAELRARYHGHPEILILPAVLRISADPAWSATATRPAKPARLGVHVLYVPREIHVPLPFSAAFRALPRTTRDDKEDHPLYRVTLRYGRFHEPQVVNVAVP